MILDLMHVKIFCYLMVEFNKNAIIFGADMSSSLHIDNKKKDILVLGKNRTDFLMILHQPQIMNTP